MSLFPRLFLLLSLVATGFAHAVEERNLSVQSGKGAERRVALVIGNSAYAGAPLKNPVNDARDMAAALRKLGFEVIEKTDTTQKDMNLAIAQFGDKLRADTVALFFFAGHGMQVKGKNYIIPIDAQITSEATVRAMTVDVDTVMDQLAVSPMNIVILDACRNNPFERRFRSAGGGLAQMDAPKGSLIAYATAPGKVANDGEGKNGLYTQELLKHIQTPGLPLEAVFKRVRNGVMQGSGEAQTPWEASSLTGDFYFQAGTGGQNVPATQVASLSPQLAGARTAAQIEDELWDAIKNSERASEFEEYLKGYPKGRYVIQARIKLKASRSEPKPDSRPPKAELVQSPRKDDSETDVWNMVMKSNAREDYLAYASQYPRGKYLSLAKARLKKLDDDLAAANLQKEQDAWQAAEKDDSEAGYQNYIGQFPNGRYLALAKARAARLQQDVGAKQERDLWEKVGQAKTVASINAYLEKYPNGKYASNARALLPEAKEREQNLAGRWQIGWSTYKSTTRATLDVHPSSNANSFTGQMEIDWSDMFGEQARVSVDVLLQLAGNELAINPRGSGRILSKSSGVTGWNPDSLTLRRISAQEFKGRRTDTGGSGSEDVTMRKIR